MTAICLKRTISGCEAADDAAKGYLRKWPIGEERKADVKKSRAHRSLRRYWVLVNLVLDNSDQFKSEKQVHEFLKRRAGHVITIVSRKTGEVYELADSIDYDTIEDEDEFQAIWNRVVQVVAEDILGTGIPVVEAEIQRLIGFSS